MSRSLAITFVTMGLCAGFIAGWFVAHRHIQNTIPIVPASSADGGESTLDCDHATDNRWQTVRLSSYMPVKMLYYVAWQFCSGNIDGQRVRVMDSNFSTIFFEYGDDEILRVENLDLLGDHIPELLVMTGSAGTDDRTTWHIISEVNGKLYGWEPANYNAAAKKLLGPDEDFCCKDWNFHLQGSHIFLARGIYHKGDGNCCPSRGGVVVRLAPTRGAFKLKNTQRVGKSEYEHWRSAPFCIHCALASTP
jgi:hypothetical protein